MKKTEDVKRSLKINFQDNVATALVDIRPGDQIEVQGLSRTKLSLTAKDSIPFGHKVALEDIAINESVVKYGASIGSATMFISRGEHIHVHNLRSSRVVDHG